MHVYVESLYFSIVFAALYFSSTQYPYGQGGGLLSEKRTGVDRVREGAENWQKCAGILFG